MIPRPSTPEYEHACVRSPRHRCRPALAGRSCASKLTDAPESDPSRFQPFRVPMSSVWDRVIAVKFVHPLADFRELPVDAVLCLGALFGVPVHTRRRLPSPLVDTAGRPRRSSSAYRSMRARRLRESLLVDSGVCLGATLRRNRSIRAVDSANRWSVPAVCLGAFFGVAVHACHREPLPPSSPRTAGRSLPYALSVPRCTPVKLLAGPFQGRRKPVKTAVGIAPQRRWIFLRIRRLVH